MQCPTAKDYLEFVRNRQLVTFRPLEGEVWHQGAWMEAAGGHTRMRSACAWRSAGAVPLAAHFRHATYVALQQGEEGVMELELLKSDSYDDVSKALASRLGLDHPLKLRLTGGPRGACALSTALA